MSEIAALNQKVDSIKEDMNGFRDDMKGLTEALRDLIRIDGDMKRLGDAVRRIGIESDDHETRIRIIESKSGKLLDRAIAHVFSVSLGGVAVIILQKAFS